MPYIIFCHFKFLVKEGKCRTVSIKCGGAISMKGKKAALSYVAQTLINVAAKLHAVSLTNSLDEILFFTKFVFF